MAFQRPFLISLKRADSSLQWGFSVFGGKEYGEPTTVKSVSEDSVAERCGLRDGDEIIQVGRVNIQDLTLGQVYELMARCGNKIEMFVIREDLLSPRKGKEPPSVKAIVHNPYNSPLQLYSAENIADTLGKQTEVLTEGHISTEEEDGPENLSFKQKSAVFQLLEEQAQQESPPKSHSSSQNTAVKKPKTAPPPPPPKPKAPPNEHLFNGDVRHHTSTPRVEHHKKVEFQSEVNEYRYQQEPVQQTRVYQQQSSYDQGTTYQALNQSNYRQSSSSNYDQGYHSPTQQYQVQSSSYQQSPQSPTRSYQQQGYQIQSSSYQQSPQSPTRSYHQQGPQSPTRSYQQQGPQSPTRSYQQQGPQSPTRSYQQQQQSQQPQVKSHQQQSQQSQAKSYQQQHQSHQSPTRGYQQQHSQQQQSQRASHHTQKAPVAVSSAEFKIGPPPPPRVSSSQQNAASMTAVYKQQYENHLQQQNLQQQQYYQMLNNYQDTKPTAHIINEDIFENNATTGTPITYKAPPAAPPKPAWPPANPQQNEAWKQSPTPSSPSALKNNISAVWPPRQPSVRELPRTGFNPAAVREQGTGRRCVWPPPKSDDGSGRTTPQSPVSGRRINWNPSPSPPTNRRNPFGTSQSPARRKDIPWPPPAPQSYNAKEQQHRPSPRLSRKAKFDDYIKEHASSNVPATYRAPPGTQHIEFC